MIQKTYISAEYMQLQVVVVAKGERHVIEFTSGQYQPFKRNGTFTTTDKDIMDALEHHPQYPGEFYVLDVKGEEETTVDPVVEPIVDPVLPTVKNPEAEKIDMTTLNHSTDEAGVVKVGGITSGQKAKIYLNQNFDIPMSKLVNNQMIMDEAKKANVVFTDWVQ